MIQMPPPIILDAPAVPDIPALLDPLLLDANLVAPFVLHVHPALVDHHFPVHPPLPPQVPFVPVAPPVPPEVLVAPPVLPNVLVGAPNVLVGDTVPPNGPVFPPVPPIVPVPPHFCTVVVKVEQRQIVTQHNVIDSLLLNDDVDPEDDGKPIVLYLHLPL